MAEANLHHPIELSPLTRSAYASACREILKRTSLHALGWRHHGLGMLQAELSESLRVHIWHPKLRTLDGESFRDVHDHRFTLMSFVAVGSVTDIPFSVVPHDYGHDGEGPIGWDKYPTADVHEILHAKEQERRGCSTATVSRLLGPVYVAREEERTYKAGSVYAIRRRDFHTTRITGVALTVVHRSDFDDKLARVLSTQHEAFVPSAIVPVSPESLDLRRDVLKEANEALYVALGDNP